MATAGFRCSGQVNALSHRPLAVLLFASVFSVPTELVAQAVPETINQLLRTRQYEQAISILEKLAAEDHVGALRQLGKFYSAGRVVERNSVRAVAYFERAANLGDAASQYFIGQHFLRNAVSTGDLEQGIEWLQQAADGGYHAAVGALEKAREMPVLGRLEKLESNSPVVVLGAEERGDYLVGLAARGDRIMLDAALAGGISVNSRDRNGRTALSVALQAGDGDMVEMLLSRGVDVNLATLDGLTPLLIGVRLGLTELVALLLGAGADVTTPDRRGHRPVIYAVRANRQDLAQLLLDYGANINATDSEGRSLLDIAYGDEDQAMFGFLSARGAEYNDRQRQQNLKTRRQISSYKETSAGDLVFAAIQQRNQALLIQALENPTAVEARNADGLSPMAVAVIGRNKAAIKQLAAAGARVDSIDDLGLTPLHHAIRMDEAELLELLETHRFQQSVVSIWRENPLHYAIRLGRFDRAVQLLEYNYDPFFENESGENAINLASRFNAVPVLAWLGFRELPLVGEGHSLASVLRYAVEGGAAEAVDFLLHQAGADVQWFSESRDLPALAAARGNTLILKRLLKAGAGVDDHDSGGTTALMSAAASGCRACVEVLLERDANPDRQDQLGNTALHYAALNGNAEIESLLLASDANPRIVNYAGVSFWSISNQESR